jgi:hypothetical protein
MTTPTGTISLNNVNVELGLAGTTTINMNQANVRTLAGVGGSGTIISMNDLRGKSNRVTINYVFSANTANAALNLSALSGYVASKSDITITVNSGVYLYATTTGGYGLNLSGATTGDTVTIVNNGNIMGMGGAGTDGDAVVTTLPGLPGGPALNLGIGVNPTINNQSGYIGGGGGGGGGYRSTNYSIIVAVGGGGGAGGGKGSNNYSGLVGVATGGAGGAIGSNGGNGVTLTTGSGTIASAGGGGRIFPSTATTLTGTGVFIAGIGGSGGGTASINGNASPYTSVGGGPSQAGSNAAGNNGGAGGGYGASGGNGFTTVLGGVAFSGGAGGKGVNLNGRSVTWTGGSASTNRVYGAIS